MTGTIEFIGEETTVKIDIESITRIDTHPPIGVVDIYVDGKKVSFGGVSEEHMEMILGIL